MPNDVAPDPDQPVEVVISDVFDLHSFAPRDMMAAAAAYLEEAHRRGFRHVRIVHGRGIGLQRERLRQLLAQTRFVRRFGDAPEEAGGRGATLVELWPSE